MRRIRIPFRFAHPKRGFRLVVFASTEKKAREYVNRAGISSGAHRGLKFQGKGHPSSPEGWVAANTE